MWVSWGFVFFFLLQLSPLCVRVCVGGSSVTFSRAAFFLASTKASAPFSLPPVNLGLTGTGRLFPIVVDEEVGGEYCLPPNLTVSSGPLAQDVLPPASVAPQAQEVFRRELFGTAQAAFEVSAAPGAVRTYVAAFRAIAP